MLNNDNVATKAIKIQPNLVLVNGVYLHRGWVYGITNNIRLGIIGGNDAYIFAFDAILD